MTLWLSPHFSLEELTITSHRNLDNAAPDVVRPALKDLASRLEAVRELLGNLPILISSGYRSPVLNAAVGGVPGSAHLTGHAADFICPAFGDPLAVCQALAASAIAFDQLIQEGVWTHISFDPRLRRQLMTRRARGYHPGLTP